MIFRFWCQYTLIRVNNNGIWDPNVYVCIYIGWTSVFCLLCDIVSFNSIWFILSLPHVCSQNCIRHYSPHADMRLIPAAAAGTSSKSTHEYLLLCIWSFMWLLCVHCTVGCIFEIKDNQISRCSCLNLIPIQLYRWLYAVIFQFTNSDWFLFASICISAVYYLKWFSSEWQKPICIHSIA